MKTHTLAFLIFFTPIFADIIYVPTDVSTIQAGIDSASTGDTVLVMTGDYVENINFNGKEILVSSLFILNNDSLFIELTTINGDEISSVVIFDSNEDSTSILNGFTILGGLGYFADPDGDGESNHYGGGIYCELSSPTLSNLIIKNNSSPDGGGGGIFCYDSNPIIANSIIMQNSSSSVGGGLYCKASSSPQINNVIFDGNWSSHGGGAYIRNNSISEFNNCVFKNNFTDGTGGGISLKNNADIILNHVFFINNSSDYYGGALYCNNAGPYLNHVTITMNESGSGGGIYCRNGSEPSLLNTIVWDNIGEEIYFRGNEDENAMSIAYSDIEAGTDGVTTNDNVDVDWLAGNINVNPFFCRPSDEDYTLVGNSPCAVSGLDSTYIGAYDIGCPAINLGPVWHVSLEGDDQNDGAYETPYASIARALQQAEDGDTILIHQGEYFESINFYGKQIVIGSLFLTTGDSTYIAETIIKGFGPGSLVIFENGEDSTSVLIGFTLSEGSSTHGGAIYISDSSPYIEDIFVSSNTADYGGGIYLNNGTPHIYNIFFDENSANYGGAIFFEESSFSLDKITINNNLAYYGAGVYLHNSTIDIQNSLIVKNESFSEGGAVYSSNSNFSTHLVTIADNVSFNGGGALYAFDNSNIEINSSIIWNNSPQDFMCSAWEAPSLISIMYSDVSYGENGIITNNNGDVMWDSSSFDIYPLFCNADSGDYQLAENSPCLYLGEENYYIGAYDVGCDIILSNQEDLLPEELSLLNSYPNPFNPNITIPFTLPVAQNVEVLIIDILGKVVAELSNKTWSAGKQSIIWQADQFSSGIYFIHFTAGDFKKIQRIILLK